MRKNITYDAMGQRIAKTVTNKNETTGDKFVTTYYMRDPQGNVLEVYEHKHGDSDNGTFTLAEQHLYGAGRLGMRKRDLALNTTNANETPATYYELTNHLGNVMAVISDEASTTDEPTVVSLTDYYPYGMEMGGRSYSAGDYRYGFNGKENFSNGNDYDYGFRIYNSQICKFLSVDPLSKSYPWYSPYQFAGNKPIPAIDIDGLEEKFVIHYLSQKNNGETYISSTKVVINPYKVLEENGKKYATTTVMYCDVANNRTLIGETLKEEITPDGMIPSAAYDYTQDVIEGKVNDDVRYMAGGEATIRLFRLVKRDMSAPDNSSTMEDLEALDAVSAIMIPIGSTKSSVTSRTGSGKNSSKNSSASNEKITFTQKHGPNGSNEPHKVTTEIPDGYKKIKERTKGGGAPVYSNGKNYIFPDLDGHNGGMWKMAKSVDDLGSKSTRMGTYDAKLNRIGD